MDKKLSSIQDRATKALFMFDASRVNEINVADVLAKTNEALRLIRELAATIQVAQRSLSGEFQARGKAEDVSNTPDSQ